MTHQATAIKLVPNTTDCSNCRVRPLCLPKGLNAGDVASFSRIVRPAGRLRPHGDAIFRQGDKLKSLYLIKTGSVKSFMSSADGCEQTLGFHYAGDLIGMDAIEGREHLSSAVTLEHTSLCELPIEALERQAQNSMNLLHRVLAEFSRELRHDQEMRLVLNQRDAEGRLAIFLTGLSRRMAERGFSPMDLRLTMSRYDIANYLGIAPETVSRTLTNFERSGLLEVERKELRIKDGERLGLIANPLAAERSGGAQLGVCLA